MKHLQIGNTSEVYNVHKSEIASTLPIFNPKMQKTRHKSSMGHTLIDASTKSALGQKLITSLKLQVNSLKLYRKIKITIQKKKIFSY